ncbi:MAG: hypothetical protein WAT79_08540 [Saprospiraceae bacterium]
MKKDKSIVGKLTLLTPKQKELIINTKNKYVKIMLLQGGLKNERLYVSNQNEPGEDIYETETIKPFIS